MLHLVVICSDGRKMLATVPPGSTISALRQQLAAEIGDTFGTPLPNGLRSAAPPTPPRARRPTSQRRLIFGRRRIRYLGKVVVVPGGAAELPGALPEHFALSAAAVASALLQDGDTVLAVEGAPASVVEPAMNALTGALRLAPYAALDSAIARSQQVGVCVQMWGSRRSTASASVRCGCGRLSGWQRPPQVPHALHHVRCHDHEAVSMTQPLLALAQHTYRSGWSG